MPELERATAEAAAKGGEPWRAALWRDPPRNAIVAAARLKLQSAVVALQRTWRGRRLRRLRTEGVVCPITQEAVAYPAVVLWRPGPPARRTFINAASFYEYARASGRFVDPVTRRGLDGAELERIDGHMRSWGLAEASGPTALAAMAVDVEARRVAAAADAARLEMDSFAALLRLYAMDFVTVGVGIGPYARGVRQCLLMMMRREAVGYPRAREAAAETAAYLRATAAGGGEGIEWEYRRWLLRRAEAALSLDVPFTYQYATAGSGMSWVLMPRLVDLVQVAPS